MIIGLLVEGCSMLPIGPSFVFPFLSPRPWFVYLAMTPNGVGMAMVTVSSAADMIDAADARDYEKNISLFAVVSGLINAATFSSGALCSPISGALTAAFGFRQSISYFLFIIFLHFIVTIVTTVVEKRWSSTPSNNNLLTLKCMISYVISVTLFSIFCNSFCY